MIFSDNIYSYAAKMNRKKILIIIVIVGIAGFFLWKGMVISREGTKSINIKQSEISGAAVVHACIGTPPSNPPLGYKPCTDSPLAQFRLKIINNTSRTEKQITTDSMGRFQIELTPGQYMISAETDTKYLSGGPFSVEVKPGEIKNIQLKFKFNAP